MADSRYQLGVVGGGSAGIGTALAAARLGVKTILIEQDRKLGGTSVNSGVNCWEPVAGATGIPFDIYRQLQAESNAVGIYSFGRHCCHPQYNVPPFPGGESIIDPTWTYADTLHRCGTRGIGHDMEQVRKQWHGIIFEPDAFDQVVRDMLAATKNCNTLSGKQVIGAHCSKPGKVESVTLDDGASIQAEMWVDCSGELAKLAGAELLHGEEARSSFGEPSAPETPRNRYNAVSLIFRCTPCDTADIAPLPQDIPSTNWWSDRFPSLCCNQYPNGDLNCNMLPTMSGIEYLELGEAAAYAECQRRVLCYWHHLQTEHDEFRGYRLSHIFPRIGVRETFRVRCEYMLSENDLRQSLSHQTHDDVITISDHMMDSHGASGKASGELQEPYGIPFRCLIPRGFHNLLVAGRIAGFSSIAASSCRLSRTMMQLGQAAGTAALLAIQQQGRFPAIDHKELSDQLRRQGVQLTWPTPGDIKARLAAT